MMKMKTARVQASGVSRCAGSAAPPAPACGPESGCAGRSGCAASGGGPARPGPTADCPIPADGRPIQGTDCPIPAGRLHSLETMGLVDGPGIRTVFFLQGCPLRCQFCHNPDTQAGPAAGVGERITVDRVVETARRYRSYYGRRGGVTLSGGEPLMQAPFAAACFRALHAEGVHTCLDTSGYGFGKQTAAVLAETDTLLLDIKAFDPNAWRVMTGRDMAAFERFVELLRDFSGSIWLRHVMVPGRTDDAASMNRFGDWLDRHPWVLARLDRIQILPYHTAGVEKYRRLGRPYALAGVPPLDPAVGLMWERKLTAALAGWRQTGVFGPLTADGPADSLADGGAGADGAGTPAVRAAV